MVEGGGEERTEIGGDHPTGEWRADPEGRHEFRYFVHEQSTDLVSDSGVESLDDHAEWRPDPGGGHQFRYFVKGEPTYAVSDNGVQLTDPPGQISSGVPRAKSRRNILIAAAVGVFVLIAVAIGVATGGIGSSSPTTTTASTTSTTLSPAEAQSGFFDPGTLAASFQEELNSDLSSDSNLPSVENVLCVNQAGPLFVCNVEFADGTSITADLTVAEDGESWVSTPH